MTFTDFIVDYYLKVYFPQKRIKLFSLAFGRTLIFLIWFIRRKKIENVDHLLSDCSY